MIISKQRFDMKIYTVGYGNRHPKDFFKLLEDNNINILLDVRRKNTKAWCSFYSITGVEMECDDRGITYLHVSNLANNCESLKEYDEWLTTTSEGECALARLIRYLTANKLQNIAIMCSEIKAENCHRKIITDFLAERGYDIQHI
jgi:uncharacterized protein (DUF488 family)